MEKDVDVNPGCIGIILFVLLLFVLGEICTNLRKTYEAIYEQNKILNTNIIQLNKGK